MKVKRQGWVNICRDKDNDLFISVGTIYNTKEISINQFEQLYQSNNVETEIKLIDTIQIEWEEEV